MLLKIAALLLWCTHHTTHIIKFEIILVIILSITLMLKWIAAALQSIFPQTELGTFMALNKQDKEKQLKELTSIVTGIRLFNRECAKGGEGIDECT